MLVAGQHDDHRVAGTREVPVAAKDLRGLRDALTPAILAVRRQDADARPLATLGHVVEHAANARIDPTLSDRADIGPHTNTVGSGRT